MYESDSDIEEKYNPLEEIPPDTARTNNVLPAKSAKTYERLYAQFMEWRDTQKIDTFSETVLIAYFDDLSKKLKSTSLWAQYSILKSMLSIKHKVDISSYSALHTLLKEKSEGYEPKKSKTFSTEEIKRFIENAPDNKYLLYKVVCIFGIMGACRRHELHNLKLKDVTDTDSALIVTIKNPKSKVVRKFTITEKYYEMCKKYMKLRPKNCVTPAFFLNYLNEKCTIQNVGINKFGNMGKGIATYLNLSNPNLYTGHCFRRSSETILDDVGGNITSIKCHGDNGGWKSATLTENCVEESMQNKINETSYNIEYNQCNNSVTVTPSTTTFTGIIPELPQFHFNNCTIHITVIKKE